MSLEHLLKAYRVRQAAIRDLPCYSVFGDVLIRSIIERKPRNGQELAQIKGMTPERCQWYGEDILRMVRTAPQSASRVGECLVTLRHGGGNGQRLTKPKLPAKRPGCDLSRDDEKQRARRPLKVSPAGRDCGEDDVYILELQGGRIYVGKSGNVGRRVGQHLSGGGSAFTKAFPPTGHLLPRLGNVRGCGDAAERDETLRYMFLRGIEKVRGWRYTTVDLTREMVNDAECNIRELFDLCRRCGGGNHFMGACSFEFDRLGRRIPAAPGSW